MMTIYDFCKSYILPLILGIVFLPVSIAATVFVICTERPRAFVALSCFVLVVISINHLVAEPLLKNNMTVETIAKPAKKAALTVTSSAFLHKTSIPKKYTCEGDNVNPPVTIGGVPANAKSLVLIVDDPDAPMGTFDHWTIWNIKPTNTIIPENTVLGTEGKNGSGKNGYTGPCPPTGTHRYFFKVYALDKLLALEAGVDKKTVEKAMKGHILASGELVGLYQKQNK
ncbi:MAG TPA: YbhB/YbcL family Raf kinase inhibitor-like protein [Flavobacteriales bacterium]|nr:YbhB/YbcL family Raf kinase inhibitor-like protein [Flavobacteriales bacterium]